MSHNNVTEYDFVNLGSARGYKIATENKLSYSCTTNYNLTKSNSSTQERGTVRESAWHYYNVLKSIAARIMSSYYVYQLADHNLNKLKDFLGGSDKKLTIENVVDKIDGQYYFKKEGSSLVLMDENEEVLLKLEHYKEEDRQESAIPHDSHFKKKYTPRSDAHFVKTEKKDSERRLRDDDESRHFNLGPLNLLCWNFNENKFADTRREVVTNYINSLEAAHIIFFQEVPWVLDGLFADTKKNERHLDVKQADHYEIACSAEESRSCVNCVFYDKRIFVHWEIDKNNGILVDCYKLMKEDGREGTDRRPKDKKRWQTSPIYEFVNTRKRLCFSILAAKEIKDSKFIVACLHNYYRSGDSQKMAILACRFLQLLSTKTGYPILLAGDFNTKVLSVMISQKICKEKNVPVEIDKDRFSLGDEIKALGFDLLDYNVTPHRESAGKIDFFLCLSIGKKAFITVTDVKAELAIKGAKFKSENDKKTMNMKMKTLDKVSNHDPLKATLYIKGINHKSGSKLSCQKESKTAFSKKDQKSESIAKAESTSSETSSSELSDQGSTGSLTSSASSSSINFKSHQKESKTAFSKKDQKSESIAKAESISSETLSSSSESSDQGSTGSLTSSASILNTNFKSRKRESTVFSKKPQKSESIAKAESVSSETTSSSESSDQGSTGSHTFSASSSSS